MTGIHLFSEWCIPVSCTFGPYNEATPLFTIMTIVHAIVTRNNCRRIPSIILLVANLNSQPEMKPIREIAKTVTAIVT